jgi:hypothetical protein
MKVFWPSYFNGGRLMMTDVLSIADKFIREGVH